MNLSLSQSDDLPRGWLDENTINMLHDIAVGLDPPERAIGIVIVDDARIREINREFRGKDEATDVISFSYLDDEGPICDNDLAGEIYVSFETLTKEANDLGIDPKHLFLRIGVHGLLHVIGYDHKTDSQARRMESKERTLLQEHLGSGAVDALF